MDGGEVLPWEIRDGRGGQDRDLPEDPAMLVDLRRCIGCHACSIACKTEHAVPLGTFRMRVRWLPRPDRPTIAFVPLFDGSLCDFGVNRRSYGMQPACVDACPTHALTFGDADDPEAEVARLTRDHDAKPLNAPEANLKDGVLYIGAEEWQHKAIHKGCELDRRDEDIIYEQR